MNNSQLHHPDSNCKLFTFAAKRQRSGGGNEFSESQGEATENAAAGTQIRPAAGKRRRHQLLMEGSKFTESSAAADAFK